MVWGGHSLRSAGAACPPLVTLPPVATCVSVCLHRARFQSQSRMQRASAPALHVDVSFQSLYFDKDSWDRVTLDYNWFRGRSSRANSSKGAAGEVLYSAMAAF